MRSEGPETIRGFSGFSQITQNRIDPVRNHLEWKDGIFENMDYSVRAAAGWLGIVVVC